MFPQFVYQLRLDCIVTLRPCDLSSPPRSISTSGNCLTRSTPLFFLLRLQKFSHLILRPSSFPAALSRTYTHLSLEIPGPRQKAGTAHELKPLSIPPVTSGNLQDLVFVPGSLGLIRNSAAHCFAFMIRCTDATGMHEHTSVRMHNAEAHPPHAHSRASTSSCTTAL